MSGKTLPVTTWITSTLQHRFVCFKSLANSYNCLSNHNQFTEVSIAGMQLRSAMYIYYQQPEGVNLSLLCCMFFTMVLFLPTCFAYINWVPLAVTVVKIREPLNPAVNSMRVWSASELHAHSCFLYRVDMYFRLLDTDFCLHGKQIQNVFNWMVDCIFNMQYMYTWITLFTESFRKSLHPKITRYKLLFVRKPLFTWW